MNTGIRHTAPRRVTTVVIGGGQAGLASSYYLSSHGIDHVVLERGEVANSWRHERWDSLRLLTPNWQSQLPGQRYQGNNPNGYMTMSEVVEFISDYARTCDAPLHLGTTVTGVQKNDFGYRVCTNQGDWHCRTLVIASGAFNKPVVPPLNEALPNTIESLTPHSYRNPDQLADGGVLVVGAAATGLQIADEIQASGRQVTLAAGEHVRMPRLYRGRDIQHWMQATGLLSEDYREVEDIKRARRLPSAQLIGTPEQRNMDLNSLSEGGVLLVGRLCGVNQNQAQFSGSLANAAKLADLKMGRLLKFIDEWIMRNPGWDAIGEPTRPAATRLDPVPRLSLDLASGEVKTVIWATGFRPDYSWLNLPVLDRKGLIQHDGGVCELPGLYVMGLPFLRRRKSSFMCGAGDDARDTVRHLAAFLAQGHRKGSVGIRPANDPGAAIAQAWR
jgi:putative flavoprotein involved in K+ transport